MKRRLGHRKKETADMYVHTEQSPCEQRAAICKPRTEVLGKTNCACALISVFWLQELWGNNFCSLSHSVCGTLLWQPWLTNTPMNFQKAHNVKVALLNWKSFPYFSVGKSEAGKHWGTLPGSLPSPGNIWNSGQLSSSAGHCPLLLPERLGEKTSIKHLFSKNNHLQIVHHEYGMQPTQKIKI